MIANIESDPGDLPYMYAVMILHEVQNPVTPEAIRGVITATGMELTAEDDAYIVWLAHELEGKDIDELMIPVPCPVVPVEPEPEPEPEPEAEPEDEEEPDNLWTNLFGPES